MRPSATAWSGHLEPHPRSSAEPPLPLIAPRYLSAPRQKCTLVQPGRFFSHGRDEIRLDDHLAKLLRGGRDRTIYISTKKGANGRCSALVRMKIASIDFAELRSVFVKLSGPLSVSYLDVKGKDPKTGRALQERLER